MSDTLVQYLREARATEAGLTQVLKVHIAATPIGAHRSRVEEHLEETREHERLLAQRLEELGEIDGGQDPLGRALSLISAPVGLSLGAARAAARAMLSLLGLPMHLLRPGEARDADRVLRNVRAEAASEALEVATYTAIERLAAAEGDEETARLAAEIRADEERMLSYLLGVAGEVGERSQVAGRGSQEAPARPAPVHGNGAPEPPTPIHVSEEPEIVAEVGEPGAEEPAGAEVEVREPWEGYDRMKAAEIERRLDDSSDELAAVVRLYEAAGKNRQSVIRAAELRLRVP